MPEPPTSQTDYDTLAARILREVPLVDGHNDFPYFVRGWHLGVIDDGRFDAFDVRESHTDLSRLRKGGVGAQIWSAYVPRQVTPESMPGKTLTEASPACNKNNEFQRGAHLDSLLETMQQIDLIHNLVAMHAPTLGLATSADDVWEIFRSGRVASLIGVEGLHQIANSASVLRNLHRLGVRYVTLAHNSNNAYADSATAPSKAHNGLSSMGVDMVCEMNRIGMIIDLSHTSEEVQAQTLRLSRAPVVYSHSSCIGVCDHPRNVSDANMDLLKANRGVLMISFIPELTGSGSMNGEGVARVADHIQYAVERIGDECVGIGSDFDGVMTCAQGLGDVSRFPALISELLRRGMSGSAVRGIVGLNFLRVLREVQVGAADALAAASQTILSDEIGPVFDEDLKDEIRQTRLVDMRETEPCAVDGGC